MSYFGSQYQDIVHPDTEGIVAGMGRAWSPCISSQGTDSRQKVGESYKTSSLLPATHFLEEISTS